MILVSKAKVRVRVAKRIEGDRVAGVSFLHSVECQPLVNSHIYKSTVYVKPRRRWRRIQFQSGEMKARVKRNVFRCLLKPEAI